MSTYRLYYQDCYLSEFSAHVVDSSDDGRCVYLDSTAFYPSSGGQPNDLGTLNGTAVVDVIGEGERIAHLLEEPLSETTVDGRIAWARRYDHMQQHTGQHLLSAVFVDLFDAQTLSFHMGSDVSSIELSMKELADRQIDQIERRANEIVWEARPVHIFFEEAHSAEGLRKASARSGTLRIIEVAGLDRSACGGTHVRSTAELGPIQILRSERVRGNVRAEFVCGRRALVRAKEEHRTLAELSHIASSSSDKLPGYLGALIERTTQLEKTNQRLSRELAQMESEQLYRRTEPSPDGIRRCELRAESIDDSTRAKVQAFTGFPKAVALAVGNAPPGVLLACSSDSGVNAGFVLKQVLAKEGARGGGSPTLAQGSLPSQSALETLKKEVGF